MARSCGSPGRQVQARPRRIREARRNPGLWHPQRCTCRGGLWHLQVALDGAWPFGAWLVAFVFTQMVEIPIYVTGLRNVVGDVTWTVADAAIGLGESCTLPRKRLY
jgi:hypothetical protein